MFLEGRPPVNVGVTSNGDIFGGSQITFGDVLGDQQFTLFAASIAQYRSFAGSYVNLSRRFQFALQGFSQTQFFYGQLGGLLYDPAYAGLISRSDAIATRTVEGGSAIGIYPFSRYRRVELSGGLMHLNESYNDPALQASSAAYQQQQFGTQILQNGTVIPFGAAFIQETTVFREFGPLAGNTMRLAYTIAPKIAGSLSRQTLDGDARYYMRIGTSGVFATRIRAFTSRGDFPDFTYFGGNSEMRGYDYLSFLGQNALFANAELRFPLIEAALTPVGVIGGVRGVFFINGGGAWFRNSTTADPCTGGTGSFKFLSNTSEVCKPITGVVTDPAGFPVNDPTTGLPIPTYGAPVTVSGLRLQDARASYGIGLETFALGFPIHFDWSWRTLLNKAWEDVVFASQGGSAAFRKPQFTVWVGYDF
jgi:hypothetical protein